MARLPNSFRSRNRTTQRFREFYDKLPANIQELTRQACRLFDDNPDHPSLRRHELLETKRSACESDSFSVSISMQYRAINFVCADGMNVWYWIGSHADYERFTGKK